MPTTADCPPMGMYFKVSIDGLTDSDSAFQEASGLSVSLTTQDVKEGGQNRYMHKLPVRAQYQPLVLKRALQIGSPLIDWCKEAIEDFSFHPKNIHLMLLNVTDTSMGEPEPIASWHIVHAYPIKWEVAGLNAMANELVIETIHLNYNYFTINNELP